MSLTLALLLLGNEPFLGRFAVRHSYYEGLVRLCSRHVLKEVYRGYGKTNEQLVGFGAHGIYSVRTYCSVIGSGALRRQKRRSRMRKGELEGRKKNASDVFAVKEQALLYDKHPGSTLLTFVS